MHQVRKLLRKSWGQLNSPLAKVLLDQIRDESRDPLEQLKGIIGTLPVVEPKAYSRFDDYLRDCQAVSLIKKLNLADAASADARYQKALTKFLSSEEACAQTNAFITRLINGPYECDKEHALYLFLQKWRRNMSRVLGPLPKRLGFEFSSGSTLSDKGQETTLPDKLSSEPTCYADCLDIHRHTIDGMHTATNRWNPNIVKYNKFFTVDKNAEEDRGCAVEASEAIRLQLAIGKELRKRYHRFFGIVLEEAQELHRRLVCDASWKSSDLIRELATIDLSSASDTIARELVRALLPSDWWLLLNSCRAHFTKVGDRIYHSAKFSSMGNGFTFELETLIFRTLLMTLECEEAYAYGDDLIVPEKDFRTVCNALKVWGFTPNLKKTFGEGPFRESCGGDFFDGYEVRPYFLKETPEAPHQWMAIHNGLKAVKHLDMRAAQRFCIDQVPKNLRIFGPSHLGDLVFHDELAEPYQDTKECGTTVPYWLVWAPVPWRKSLHSNFLSKVVNDCALLGMGLNVSPRDSVSGYKLKRINAYGKASSDFIYLGPPREKRLHSSVNS